MKCTKFLAHPLCRIVLQKVEAGSIQLKLEYDTDWNLSIEVVKADIIPADEDKEKEGLLSFISLSYFNSIKSRIVCNAAMSTDQVK